MNILKIEKLFIAILTQLHYIAILTQEVNTILVIITIPGHNAHMRIVFVLLHIYIVKANETERIYTTYTVYSKYSVCIYIVKTNETKESIVIV